MAPMSTRRKHLGCSVFNNMIYAVGGRDDCTELSSAERYNPATNTWSPIVAMMSRRSGVSARINNYLLVINNVAFFHVFLARAKKRRKKVGYLNKHEKIISPKMREKSQHFFF
jgi:hypothetical protein